MLAFVAILLLLNLCHFVADYTHLSTPWMLAAKRFGEPLSPIWVHAAMHAVLMYGALHPFTGVAPAFWLAIIQLLTHFGIDVIKGRLNHWHADFQSPSNPSHWYLFGFDQLLHQVVIILMAYLAAIHLPA